MESELKQFRQALQNLKREIWKERFYFMKGIGLFLFIVITIALLSGCATKPEPRPIDAAELPMHDEGDRVCVLVEEDFIYCVRKNQPRTIQI